MMYATAGNLDTFLLTRSHATQPARPDLSAGDIADAESIGQLPKEERIKAFKKRRQSRGGANAKREETRGVLLLNLEEVTSLFGDIVEGLAFLVGPGSWRLITSGTFRNPLADALLAFSTPTRFYTSI
jgi:hypothetical protein